MLHDLIIWPNAVGFKETIVKDLGFSFSLVSIITMHWHEDRWYDNLKVFYSKSWQRFPFSQLQQALTYKAKHCGQGDFVLVVFDDPTPEMSIENTTEDNYPVNSRVFKKKKEYRRLTGGGHLIHTSNNPIETDRDLTLLLGLNSNDFLKQYSHCNTEDIRICRNCSGVNGYDSLSSFFYTLNHSINYCVLRNFECLPDAFYQQGHEDIDLLVENFRYMVNLTLAKPISGSENRVDYSIRIGGEDIPFDFRHVGDNYYDPAWEHNILQNRVFERGLFYIPGSPDCFYTLLYHAYLQKNQVKSDYYLKLDRYASDAGINNSHDIRTSVLLLDAFMSQYGYEYIRPNDKTVVFNRNNLAYSQYAYRYGQCLKHTEERGDNGYSYSSKVFEGKDVYVKIGTSWLLENEARFLRRLANYTCFPKILSLQSLDDGQIKLDLSRAEGKSADLFFKDVSNQKARRIRTFLSHIVDALCILNNNGIQHRDFCPANIIVTCYQEQVEISIIDFGWAADIDQKDVRTPVFLGGRYAGNHHSDCYAVGVFLMEYWPDLPYVRWVASTLFNAAEQNTESLLKRARWIVHLPLGPYDRFRLFLRRHQRISQIWHKLKK